MSKRKLVKRKSSDETSCTNQVNGLEDRERREKRERKLEGEKNIDDEKRKKGNFRASGIYL